MSSIYGAVPAGARTTGVRCPLKSNRLIAEGDCYDFQAFAQGAGPPEWQEATAEVYEKAFGGTRQGLMKRCILHQIEIVRANDHPVEYEPLLQQRLVELKGN